MGDRSITASTDTYFTDRSRDPIDDSDIDYFLETFDAYVQIEPVGPPISARKDMMFCSKFPQFALSDVDFDLFEFLDLLDFLLGALGV